MKPLNSFFEITRKGGPLGLTENLGEVRKNKPSERGHGAIHLLKNIGIYKPEVIFNIGQTSPSPTPYWQFRDNT